MTIKKSTFTFLSLSFLLNSVDIKTMDMNIPTKDIKKSSLLNLFSGRISLPSLFSKKNVEKHVNFESASCNPIKEKENVSAEAKVAFNRAIPVKAIRCIILDYCTEIEEMSAIMPSGKEKKIKTTRVFKNQGSPVMMILFSQQSEGLSHCITLDNCIKLEHGKSYEGKPQWPSADYVRNPVILQIKCSPSPEEKAVLRALSS